MILRTDTIGTVENPTKDDIKKAIIYADGKNFHEGFFVNLLKDDYQGDYLSISIGTKDNGHLITYRSNNKKVTCTQRLDNLTSSILMIKYLEGDESWINDYNWKDHISTAFFKGIETLIKSRDSNS